LSPEAKELPAVRVALPACNEEAALPPLLEACRRTLEALGRPYRVVVVDDGSRDGTPDVLSRWAERVPMRVITHPQNLGLGATIRDALLAALEGAGPDDVIVTMDADNTHPPALIPAMVESVEGEGADVVIASRYRPGSRVVGLGPVRRLMSHGARVLYKSLLPVPGVRDYTCGYRAYRASVLRRALAVYGDALFEEAGFEAMADLLLKLAALGLRFAEVPLVLRYDRKGGASKMKVARTAWRSLRLMLRRRRTLRSAAAAD
jgi:dolichol-phosphate mannosyltransferase